MAKFGYRETVRFLRRAGFEEDRHLGKGSHRVFRLEGCDEKVVVPYGKDIPVGTHKSIMRTAQNCLEKLEKNKKP